VPGIAQKESSSKRYLGKESDATEQSLPPPW
jgi:hypothetical protein